MDARTAVIGTVLLWAALGIVKAQLSAAPLSTNNIHMANDTMRLIKTSGRLAMPHNPYNFLRVDRPSPSPSYPDWIFSSMVSLV